ncbi:MAG: hypothetical protein HY001_00260 [Candidatus Portnoybacteria bacterium]|nr:hypothetical protein [Candidatus Portnoybacteria bacterium]
MMAKRHYVISIFTSLIILSALGYVLELNSIQEANASIKEGKKRIKELRLEYQTSLKYSPFGREPLELERLQEEFSLEGVGSFTLLEPSKTQFSLNPRLYE